MSANLKFKIYFPNKIEDDAADNIHIIEKFAVTKYQFFIQLAKRKAEGSDFDEAKRETSNAKSLSDKKLHPLFAFQSAPGGGKSFFFDELASLKDKDIEFISSLYDDNRTDSNAQKVLAMRILSHYHVTWSYFFDEDKLPWIDFYKNFSEHFDSLDTYTVIQSIILYSKKSVLLCIDETMRLFFMENFTTSLENLKRVLNDL
ncbi:unnamed protein product [Rhizophagus irregularis]|uniref:Uncharacterized protein n=1 Tax=Rhizophagus irregularis TaxID=588596 RepID=A0A2I1GJ52_9GLOM|nr:hypothetical protein RhiirA4_461576 [Rhizophagus irregularis]CAB4442224.1 unnamed protein product [Rhizophagus irregularis]